MKRVEKSLQDWTLTVGKLTFNSGVSYVGGLGLCWSYLDGNSFEIGLCPCRGSGGPKPHLKKCIQF